MTLEQLDRCPSTFRSDQSNGASPLGDNHQTETHFAQSDTCFNFVGVPKCFPSPNAFQMLLTAALLDGERVLRVSIQTRICHQAFSAADSGFDFDGQIQKLDE